MKSENAKFKAKERISFGWSHPLSPHASNLKPIPIPAWTILWRTTKIREPVKRLLAKALIILADLMPDKEH